MTYETKIIQDILDIMYEYQIKNNIKGECAINSIIMYDCLIRSPNTPFNKDNTKFIVGYVKKNGFIIVHCWILYNKIIVEPSYEHKNTSLYFYNLSSIEKIPVKIKKSIIYDYVDMNKKISKVKDNYSFSIISSIGGNYMDNMLDFLEENKK